MSSHHSQFTTEPRLSDGLLSDVVGSEWLRITPRQFIHKYNMRSFTCDCDCKGSSSCTEDDLKIVDDSCDDEGMKWCAIYLILRNNLPRDYYKHEMFSECYCLAL